MRRRTEASATEDEQAAAAAAAAEALDGNAGWVYLNRRLDHAARRVAVKGEHARREGAVIGADAHRAVELLALFDERRESLVEEGTLLPGTQRRRLSEAAREAEEEAVGGASRSSG